MTMKITNPTYNNLSDELFEYALEIEAHWQKGLKRHSDKELLEIFPKAKSVIPEKIREWQEVRNDYSNKIKDKLTIIKYFTTNEDAKWFWREWVKINDGKKLLECDKHLQRLKQLLWISKGREPKGHIAEEQIRAAKSVPIENLLNQKLRKFGKVLVGICPLHPEKHPSFYIYTETNTCWCYGCNQGGDSINLIKLLHGLAFTQAVRWLNNL